MYLLTSGILIITGAVLIALLNSKEKSLTLASIMLLIIGVIIMVIATYEPLTVEKYLRGEIEVTYEKVYRDSILIRTDTIIEFKNIY